MWGVEMDDNELTRKVFYALGKAAGVSEEEIQRTWSKCTPDDIKMISDLANDLKPIYKELSDEKAH
jgi:hypothetical protein